MIGKRVLARLQGKTLGACHKCGASLKRGRSCLRANHCVRCNTSYHTYDCGNRMAAVLLADNPAECPKVRSTSVFQEASSLLFRFLTQQTTFVSTQFAHKRHVTPSPVPTRGYTFSVATLVVARPDLSSVTPTGTERGKQKSFRLEARRVPERHRSIGKRRGTTKHRTLHRRREGRALFAYRKLNRFFRSQGWCGNCRSASRTSSNLRRDARRRFGVVVFGVTTRVFFVAFKRNA